MPQAAIGGSLGIFCPNDFGGNAHYRGVSRNVSNDKRIRTDFRIISDVHFADDRRSRLNPDIVADGWTVNFIRVADRN